MEVRTMKAVKLVVVLAAMLVPFRSAVVHGHEPEHVSAVFEKSIPNVPGKSLVALVVTYPPGGKSRPHRHAKSAFIYAHVLSGSIRSQVDKEAARVYHVGEGFHEAPGSFHRVSENASDREPASLLAVFVVDTTDSPITIPDAP
jgi:quercetin dioxygenase-like cupin family protein